jgi:hypothetical protein
MPWSFLAPQHSQTTTVVFYIFIDFACVKCVIYIYIFQFLCLKIIGLYCFVFEVKSTLLGWKERKKDVKSIL